MAEQKDRYNLNPLQFFGSLALAGLAGAGLAGLYFTRSRGVSSRTINNTASKALYSIADQPTRYGKAKATNNQRYLNIDSVYNPISSNFQNKRVLVIGGSRGLGLSIVKELCTIGARTITTVRKLPCTNLDNLTQNNNNNYNLQVIDGIDVTKLDTMKQLIDGLNQTGGKIDVLIVNAGYFYGPVERVTDNTLNFEEEMKMIDICGLGPLRVINALINSDLIDKNSGKIAIITSQAGSIAWREGQNPNGDNYGHHASRAVTNMIGKLLSFELNGKNNEKGVNIPVGLYHPGFNRTGMTAKYKEIWDEHGAVEPGIGAKRVLFEVDRLSVETSGSFVNCEDGLLIPW